VEAYGLQNNTTSWTNIAAMTKFNARHEKSHQLTAASIVTRNSRESWLATA